MRFIGKINCKPTQAVVLGHFGCAYFFFDLLVGLPHLMDRNVIHQNGQVIGTEEKLSVKKWLEVPILRVASFKWLSLSPKFEGLRF